VAVLELAERGCPGTGGVREPGLQNVAVLEPSCPGTGAAERGCPGTGGGCYRGGCTLASGRGFGGEWVGFGGCALTRFFAYLRAWVPMVEWAAHYSRNDFRADLIAGVVVLFITVPQVIAYAFLAGVPPEAGLYAALLALICYAAFGSSRTLAVGPTAIIAMMTLEVASEFHLPGTADYLLITIKLGFVTGLVLLVLRLVNFGNVISFLSHAVVTGFISAAALLIISNQIPAMLGLSSSLDTSLMGISNHLLASQASYSFTAAAVAILAVVLLLFCKLQLEQILRRVGINETLAGSLVKSAPMYVVIIGIVATVSLDLTSHQVPVVGAIPTDLPSINMVLVTMSELRELLPSALLIAMVIFMESTSIGSAMASKRREKLQPNQELVGLGFANIGAAFVGGFPVAGSFARTVVNFTSGARTPMASLITALLVAVVLVGFAPLFYYLPKAVLSAIIVISAFQLIDLPVIRKIFAFNPTDAVTFSFTFLAVLTLGVEPGVLIGIVISFVLLIRSSSRPHIAVVGRVAESEHFRNVLRHDVKTSPSLLAVRIDESLYFVNTRYIETFLFNEVADRPEIRNVLMICTATNFIDASGLEMLEELSDNLKEVGVTLHLAEVKGPVMDRLKETDFYRAMQGEVFFTTDIAFRELADI
jgi:sulfate permease, SulP family